jgi:pyridoxal phosphate enzyme (YggS family)
MEWLTLVKKIGPAVQLVAVSKGRSVEEILHLYKQGQRHFGESKVQEFELKRKLLPNDIQWHLIGTLQTKKVPKVVGEFHLIHSIDSLALAEKLSIVSQERGVITNILLQVNASGEPTKHGFSPDALRSLFPALRALPGLSIKGLMTMAPNTNDQALIKNTFLATKALRDDLNLQELSMGMSQDYEIALDCGATIVRIGSLLFRGQA